MLNRTRDHLWADIVLGYTTTTSKLVATMKPSWTSEIYQTSHGEPTTFTDRLADNMLESLYKMQVENWEEWKFLLQLYAQDRRHLAKHIYVNCRLKLMAPRHLEQKTEDSHFKARNGDDDRPAVRVLSEGKAKGKGKSNAKNNSGRGNHIHCITKGHNDHMEKHAHSSMTRTRKAKERDDLAHFF